MLEKYAKIKELGEGGFGRVYLAQDPVHKIPVAVKILKGRTTEERERFRREVRLLKEHVDNRYVVDVIDYDLDHDPPYVVLEYCEYGSLRSWIGKGRPWEDIAIALVHSIH